MNEPNVWMGLCESTDIRTASSCSRQIKGLHSDLLQAYSAKAAQSVSAEAAVAELDAHLSQRAQVWAARLEEQQAASVAAAERTEQLQRASLLEDARRPLLARVRALEVQLRAAQDQAAQAGVRGKGGGKMRSSMGKGDEADEQEIETERYRKASCVLLWGRDAYQDRLQQALLERRTDAESAAIKLSLVETAAQEELAAARSRSAAMEAQGQVQQQTSGCYC